MRRKVFEMVTTSAIVWLIAEGIFAVVFPVLLLIVWKKKTHAPLLPMLVGAGIFVVFALMLETLPKIPLFILENPVSAYIASHAWCYALVGALLAGIFEEVGRFVAFRFLLKKYGEKQTAITYGIGHGGIECILLLGMAAVQMVLFAVMIQNGTFDSLAAQLPDNMPEAAEQLAQLKETVLTMTPATILLGMWERICAVAIHISMSVLVFVSVQQRSKRWFFPLAIFLHAFVDIFAALYQVGKLSLPVAELILSALAVGYAYFCFRVYQKAER